MATLDIGKKEKYEKKHLGPVPGGCEEGRFRKRVSQYS